MPSPVLNAAACGPALLSAVPRGCAAAGSMALCEAAAPARGPGATATRNLWLRSSHFIPSRTQLRQRGLGSAGAGRRGFGGNADAFPCQQCPRKDSPAGNDQSKISVAAGEQGQSLLPGLAEKQGHYLVQLAGQGSPGEWAGMGSLCPAPSSTPSLQLPSAAPKPSTCIQHLSPGWARGTGSCAAKAGCKHEAKP